MENISAVIITYNEEQNIQKCLDSINEFVDEIVVVDSFSNDKTELICSRYKKLKFIRHKFNGYGEQKQFAIKQSANDWILSIDADEYLTETLQQEIRDIQKRGFLFDGYLIHRQTFYQGRFLHFCGMRSEKHLRLFNRNKGNFSLAKVHEKFELETSNIKVLNGKFIHMPYRDLSHHLSKIDKYTSFWAYDKMRAGKKCNKLKIITKSSLRFLVIYFIKLAIFDGYAGFIWAMMGSYYSFLKYAKLYELYEK